MIIYALEIIELLLASVILFMPMTNTLIYPLPQIKKVALLVYIFLSYFMTYKAMPSDVNMAVFTMGGALLIIFLSRRNIYNVGSAVAGYLVMVCLNYLVLMYLSFFGVTPKQITSNMFNLIIFEIIFCILTYVLTYLLGKGLRILAKKYYGFIKKKSMRYFIISNLCGCLIVFLTFIVLGRITGFTNAIVKQNGIAFLLLALGVAVTISAAVKLAAVKLWPQIVFKMQKHIQNIEDENKKIRSKQNYYNCTYPSEGKITIKNGASNLVLDIKDIYFIETGERGHVINIYTGNEVKTLKGTTLKEICKDMPIPLFRCHRSAVVNLEHIENIEGENILLDNGMKCKIAARSRTELINYYNSYKNVLVENFEG